MAGITDRLQKSTAKWSFAVCAPATTVAIWTPRSSASIALTGIHLCNFGNTSTTVSIFFSKSTNTRGKQVGIYSLNTTSLVFPEFNGIYGGQDVPLNVHANTSSVDVTVYGFEIAE